MVKEKWAKVGGHCTGPELTRLVNYWRKKGYRVKKVRERSHIFNDPTLAKGCAVYIAKEGK